MCEQNCTPAAHMPVMTNLSATSAIDLDALRAITSLHHFFSGHLAAAHRIDPDTICETDPACPRLRVLTRSHIETPVRERVACSLLAAQISRQPGKALASLYNHAWMKVEQGTAATAELAAWQTVVEATTQVMDAGLDEEITALLDAYAAA